MEEQKNKRAKGSQGEDIACAFLEGNGYKIIKRNYQYGHLEIDIVAKDNDELVFVEVKMRNSLMFGAPEYAITKSKLKQVKKAAMAYLVENNLSDQVCRIDAVTILQLKDCERQINHYKNV